MRWLESNIPYLLVFALSFLVVTSLPTNNDDLVDKELSNNVTTRRKRNVEKAGSLLALILYSMCFDPPDDKRDEVGCKVNVKTLHKNFPLILSPYDNSKFLYPDDQGYLYFRHEEPVFLSCSAHNNINFVKLPDRESHTFVCDCGKTFMDGDIKYDFDELVCTDVPLSTVIDANLATNYQTYAIGFYTNANNDFLNLIDVFYDELMTKLPLYVRSTISRHKLGGQQTKFGKSFEPTNHKYFDIDSYYNEDNQIESLEQQLRSREIPAPIYVKKKTKEGLIFNRGHLVPKSSMVYSAAAKATFYHLNVVPQWQCINSQNWAKIENYAVELATQLKRDLTVITGIHDQLKLPDAEGSLTSVFLYFNRNEEDNFRIPIPRYMYKIIIDKERNEGIVYVTVNNPYMYETEGSPPHQDLCKSAFTRRDGVRNPAQWQPKKAMQGWSYMCEVYDFLVSTNLNLEGTEADMSSNRDKLMTMQLLKLGPRDQRNKPGPSHSSLR